MCGLCVHNLLKYVHLACQQEGSPEAANHPRNHKEHDPFPTPLNESPPTVPPRATPAARVPTRLATITAGPPGVPTANACANQTTALSTEPATPSTTSAHPPIGPICKRPRACNSSQGGRSTRSFRAATCGIPSIRAKRNGVRPTTAALRNAGGGGGIIVIAQAGIVRCGIAIRRRGKACACATRTFRQYLGDEMVGWYRGAEGWCRGGMSARYAP